MSFLRAAARLVFMHLNSAARSVTIIQVIPVRQYKLRDNNIPPRWVDDRRRNNHLSRHSRDWAIVNHLAQYSWVGRGPSVWFSRNTWPSADASGRCAATAGTVARSIYDIPDVCFLKCDRRASVHRAPLTHGSVGNRSGHIKENKHLDLAESKFRLVGIAIVVWTDKWVNSWQLHLLPATVAWMTFNVIEKGPLPDRLACPSRSWSLWPDGCRLLFWQDRLGTLPILGYSGRIFKTSINFSELTTI